MILQCGAIWGDDHRCVREDDHPGRCCCVCGSWQHPDDGIEQPHVEPDAAAETGGAE